MVQQSLVLAQTIMGVPAPYFLAPAGSIVALLMAMAFARSVNSRSEGDAEQIRIARAVREGAMAYLKRQYTVVAGVFVAHRGPVCPQHGAEPSAGDVDDRRAGGGHPVRLVRLVRDADGDLGLGPHRRGGGNRSTTA